MQNLSYGDYKHGNPNSWDSKPISNKLESMIPGGRGEDEFSGSGTCYNTNIALYLSVFSVFGKATAKQGEGLL